MPGRVARSNVPQAQPKTVRNKSKKRHLDAFAIAGHEHADKLRIKQHRLGETLDDGPSNKRRKVQEQEDDEDDDEDDRDGGRRSQGRTGPKRQMRDADDSVEEGSDSEGNEWTMGGLGEDDDDSDLDSDMAFGESDEERFEGFTFRGSSKNKKGSQARPAKKDVRKPGQMDIDLNEDQEEEEDIEDDFGDEGVDLATMLDDYDEGEEEGEEEGVSDGQDQESLNDYSGSDSEDARDVEDEERNARILDMANQYGGESVADPSKSKSATQSKLTAADLLSGFDGETRRTAEKSIKPSKKVASGTLSAPLPKRQQDKLDRQFASQKAEEQLDRWRDTVMQNRRAEFLQFPLKSGETGAPSVNKEKFTPATQEAPSTELEANIRKIMEESGLSTSKNDTDDGVDAEDGLLKAEALSTNKMPVEEVRRRIADLRRHRDLLFREEIKAKRVKNIKSKAYRRVHRRQREREAQEDAAFLGEDGEIGKDEREKRDRKRAEARMGTRHKDSKWAKSLKATNRAAWDEDARDAVLENARRQEELKRRIAGDDIFEQSGSDIFSDGDDEGDDAGDYGLERRLERLAQGDEKPAKGLAGMKFMQAADAKRKAQNDDDIERMKRDLAVADGEIEESEKEEDESLGRAIFGPRPKEAKEQKRKTQRAELEEGSESSDGDEAEVAGKEPSKSLTAKTSAAKAKGSQKKSSGPLAKNVISSGVSSNNVQEQRPTEVESSWLSGEPEKESSKSKKQRGDDADVLALAIKPSEPTPNDTKPTRPSKQPAPGRSDGTSAGNTEGWNTVIYNNPDDDGADSEAENDGQPMLTKAQQKADFHRRAFAGDDVHLSFAADKEAAEESEDEKEASSHLPGWGSWAGDGLSKRAKKHNNRIKHNPLHKHKVPGGTAKDNRKDKGRADVIISEKGDRKGAIYKAKVLPHGFESKDQYERSLRMPIGPEWSTKETFQRSTRPRVVTAPGQVIEAIERPAI
ncbi:Utp14-domain-containing protein [Polychaeton citri CBS 116435]|uniref:Utp14-domain-containing protein n=1 Tax=Polychaeton citri CBS 116435 TaxID=1314669 RepID=A0A9P4UKP0_9PEZI|nr:Utp14-domain-containing protein [Polychaeton citri CBS 116435]